VAEAQYFSAGKISVTASLYIRWYCKIIYV